ncbi:MAG TPA: TonB family protein [Thermoanaerobaculia bacterium]|nr:TonB family protein [Thermoanaerobaculia bacterium]
MEDRVAEVLAQRAALERGPAAGIVLSIVLHGGITALAVYGAVHAKPPELANVLTIRFAPTVAPTVAPAIVPANAPKPKPAAPVIHEPVPVVETPTPVKPEAPSKNTAPPSPFGKSTKKAGPVPLPPPAPAPAATSTAPAVPDIAPGTSGVAGIEGGDFPYTVYLANMVRLIGNHWFRNPQITGDVTTRIAFTIHRDGSITDASIEQPSGNGAADRAALRAVLEASPLPPLPFGYNGTYLKVHQIFK